MRHFCLFLIVIVGVLSWGEMGHDIVAQIGWNLCTSRTQNLLKVFLGTKP
jgi:hypothetical protein